MSKKKSVIVEKVQEKPTFNSFEAISEEYNRQYELNKIDWKKNPIDYSGIEEDVRSVAAIEYPELSQDKINYIWSKVYDDHHSSFEGCIFGMKEMCEWVKNLPK